MGSGEHQSKQVTISDSRLPTAIEISSVTSVEAETKDLEGPVGVKELGGGIQLAPAIVNAIYDATGVRFKNLPAVPEKILEARYGN